MNSMFKVTSAALALIVCSSALAQQSTNGRSLESKPESGVPSVVKGSPSSLLYFAEDGSGILYTLDPSTGAPSNIGSSGIGGATAGAAPRDYDFGTLYVSEPFDINIVDADGNNVTNLGPEVAEGLAWDCSTDTLYGVINGSFFTISTVTGTAAITLAALPDDIEGIAFANGGVYGIVGFGSADSNLYFYDPATDVWSIVGDTGVDWDEVGMAYDPGSNTLYAKGLQDTLLYSIDPATGASAVIGDTGLQPGGGLAWLDAGCRTTIPALNGPGLAILLFLMLGGGALYLGRRRSIRT